MDDPGLVHARARGEDLPEDLERLALRQRTGALDGSASVPPTIGSSDEERALVVAADVVRPRRRSDDR